MELKEIRWEGVDQINLSQDEVQWEALQITVMDLQFHASEGKVISVLN